MEHAYDRSPPGLNLTALSGFMPKAVRHFWKSRKSAARKQKQAGRADQGNRTSVTAGKNMDGFIGMFRRLIIDNGIRDAEVFTATKAQRTLPGFYRATKEWDLLVISQGQLVVAIEAKSQVGSFGNNFNNRVEEAIGNSTDFRVAFREGAFGKSQPPFLGYFFVLEDCDDSREPVKFKSPHFRAFPEFENASYAKRYDILCRKLVREQLYDAAALILTSQAGTEQMGKYTEMAEDTGSLRFATVLASKVAAIAAERIVRGH